MAGFDSFLQAYPPDHGGLRMIEFGLINDKVKKTFGVAVPPRLLRFWDEVGCGFFGNHELYFFNDQHQPPLRSLIEWNAAKYWADFIPGFSPGHILFFLETCFGHQIGFCTHEDGQQSIFLLAVDTAELFLVCDSTDQLFDDVLIEPGVFVDSRLLASVKAKSSIVPTGFHYAPIVPLLFGGSITPANYDIEPADVHLLRVCAAQRRVPE